MFLPAKLPCIGESAETCNTYMKDTEPAALPTSCTNTVTIYVPASATPNVQFISDSVAAYTLQIAPPIVTILLEVMSENKEPVIVTLSPSCPDVG